MSTQENPLISQYDQIVYGQDMSGGVGVATSPITYTSSPLGLSGWGGAPSSTINAPTPVGSPAQQESTTAKVSSVLSSIGNVILGSIALSRMPSTKISQPQPTTTIAGKSGTTVTGSSWMFIAIALVVVAAIVYLLMRK